MTGFFALQSHSPFLTLLVGIIVFMGMIGIGLPVVDRVKLSSVWRLVVASLLGIQIFSLGVQGIAIAQVASPLILVSYAVLFTVLGLVTLFFQVRNNPLIFDVTAFRFRWFWIVYLGVFLMLLMAMHGSTKMDEIHYHMLLPARIVSDEGLRFYQLPWQGAVISQMTYQMSQAPFHAMGFVHLGNIISWLLAILMIWAAATLVWEASKSGGWTALIVSPIAVGMYPIVWHVTSGAHALGDISVVFTLIALVQFDSFCKKIGTGPTVLIISFLAVSALTSKLSLLPFAALVLFFLIKKTVNAGTRFTFLALIPWLLFYLPICLWTWIETGSPFGPVFTEVFGSKVYDLVEIKNIILNTKTLSRVNFLGVLKPALFSYSLLVWIFAIWLFLSKGIPRLVPAIFFFLQLLLIITMLPYDFRFLSGTQFSAIILFGIYGYSKAEWLTNSASKMLAVLLLGTLPWVALQCIYVIPFAKYLSGITPRETFNERYIAFYKDYHILDSLLPKNAVLLVKGIRLNSIFAPRDVFFSENDLPSDRPSYLFHVTMKGKEQENNILELNRPVVYENLTSTAQITRIPGQSNKLGRLKVHRVRPLLDVIYRYVL